MEQFYEMKVGLVLLYGVIGFCWGVFALRQQERYYPEAPAWKDNLVYWVNALLWWVAIPMAIRFHYRRRKKDE